MVDVASLPDVSRSASAGRLRHASECIKVGDWLGANQSLMQVLQGHPDHPEALYLIGLVCTRLGENQRAVEWLLRLVALKPEHLGAWVTLGVALKQEQRWDEAESAYERALALDPRCVDARFNWGNLQLARKRPERALLAYDEALTYAPQQVSIHINRALSLQALDRLSEALAACEQAIALAPQNALGYFHRGNMLMALQQPEQARLAYQEALARDPQHTATYNNLGNTLLELRRYEEALQAYEHALHHAPEQRDASVNRAHVLFELGQFAEAITALDAVLVIYPQDAQAYDQKGIALQAEGRLEEALQSHSKALMIDPKRELTRMNRSMCLLRMGRWVEAWPDYEARWHAKELQAQAKKLHAWQARWWQGDLANLQGTDVLLLAEQGLGDTLQFCRYVTWVAQEARRVWLHVPASLIPIMQGLEGLTGCVPVQGPWPRFDWFCPLMSLPGAAQTEPDRAWAPWRYLHTPAARHELWQSRLGYAHAPRIGLMWRGGDGSRIKGRSIDLADLLAVLPPGAQYISLQRDLPDADRVLLQQHPQIQHWGEVQTDFADAAALCDAVDLVISVDTSMAHLAGALGRPVWILLPQFCDWRWLQNRPDTPWYPSARLLRQRQQGEWGPVLSQLGTELRTCLAAGRVDR